MPTIKIRGNPNFANVIAFDFYDGIESGVGLFPCGMALRFVYLTESRTNLFKAFRIDLINGNWTKYIDLYPFLPPCGNKQFQEFSEKIEAEKTLRTFIGIGNFSLDGLLIAPISTAEIEHLRSRNCEANLFHNIHRYLKEFEKVSLADTVEVTP